MTLLKSAALGMFVLMATAVSSAQTHFPLRSGEWAATSQALKPGEQPMSLLYCLNDEMWQKALMNPTCHITQLSVTPIGASYYMDCPMKAFQMKGKVNISFDGMTHMTGKSSIDITLNGNVTHSDSQVDYRWKGPACSPNDMNIRAAKALAH